jgi:hypothetical protein
MSNSYIRCKLEENTSAIYYVAPVFDAAVCNGGVSVMGGRGGEQENFNLKLTLSILLRKICEFHKNDYLVSSIFINTFLSRLFQQIHLDPEGKTDPNSISN